MERQQDREPLGAQQPIPLVQILPDGRLAYVSLGVAPGAIAQPQPLAAHVSAQDLTGKRDRWALIVKIAGLLMLIGGILGIVARGCTAGENRGHTWAFWGVALGIDILMVITGILGLKAGRQKTAAAARRYKRFLIFFALVYILATGAMTFCFAKHEFKHINKHHGGGYRGSNYAGENSMLPEEYTQEVDKAMEQVDNLRSTGEARGRPDREGRTIPPYVPTEGEDGWQPESTPIPEENSVEESEFAKQWGKHPRHHDHPEHQENDHRRHPRPNHDKDDHPRHPHDKDDHPRPPHDQDDYPRHPRDGDYFPEPPHNIPRPSENNPASADETVTTEPAFLGEESLPEDPNLQSKHKKDKKEKKEEGREGYGHKDEMPKWNKKELKRAMMVGMGVAVLLTVGLCSCCVFCAYRLVKYTEGYEAMFPRQIPAPQLSYYYPQQAQAYAPYPYPYPYAQVPQAAQAPQAPQHASQAPQAQVFQQMPQVVQAVPVNQANLYPNLAPMGVSFPPRAS